MPAPLTTALLVFAIILTTASHLAGIIVGGLAAIFEVVVTFFVASE